MAETAYKGARVDRVLTTYSEKFDPTGFIADKFLTEMQVDKWTGLLGSYDNSHLKLVTSRIFDRSGYRTVPAVGYDINKTYQVFNHGLRDFVTERDRDEVEDPFNAKLDVTDGLRSLLKIEKEFIASTLGRNDNSFVSTNIKTLTGTAQWNDFENSDPKKDIVDAQTSVFNTAHKPITHAVIPWPVAQTLRSHPQYTGIYGTTGKFRPLTFEELSNVLGIPNILIPQSIYVDGTDAEREFWAKDVILYNQEPTARKRMRTWGLRLMKRGHNARVFVKDDPNAVNSEAIFSDTAYNYMIANVNCAYKLKNVIA